MARLPLRSFRDPTTGVLTAWGFVETNAPGEIAQVESGDFALEPGRWRWNGTDWMPFTPPPPPPTPLATALDAWLASSTPNPIQLRAILQAWRNQVT